MLDPVALFHELHLPVFRYLKRITRDHQLAEELTQDVFLRVVRSLPRYREQGQHRAWVFQIARNLVHNHRRDQARAPLELIASSDELGNTPAKTVDNLAMERALAELADLDREVFLLRELGGLSYDEIAHVSELTPDAVRLRLYRTRIALRAAMSAPIAARGAIDEPLTSSLANGERRR